MRNKNTSGGNTKGAKRDGRGPLDQDRQKKQARSDGSQGGPKGSIPDKHGGSGAGRQQGGSGSGRER